MNDSAYRPGAWFAVLESSVGVLVDDRFPPARLMSLWEAVTDGPTIDTLLDAITGGRVSDLPCFGLVLNDGGQLRLVVRSGVVATIATKDGSSRSFDSGVVSTWVEHVVTDAEAVTLERAGVRATASMLPLRSGIVAADSFEWRVPQYARASSNDPASADEELQSGFGEMDGGGDVGLGDHGDASGDTWLPDLTRAPSPEDSGTADGEAAAEEASIAADPSYDYLFGETQMRTVEEAAVRDEEAGTESTGADVSIADVAPEPGPEIPSEQSGPANEWRPPFRVGPIAAPTELPTVAVPVALETPTAVPQAEEDTDHDGLTVVRSAVNAMRGMLPPAAPGPVVHAISCPAGHPNPPQAALCRICKEPLVYQEPVTVPRPNLGSLRFSTGQVVPLDRPVVAGRSPSVERVSGADLPQLVQIDSPGNDLSRSHAEVRLEGWHVLVVDLGSVNGTVVTLPGRAPERLRPGQPCPVVPGSVVTLANEVTFTYEAAT
jgi:hypothetical protein